MRILLDTNILLRLVQEDSPHYALTLRATQVLTGEGHTLCIVPQVASEFWFVCTRTPGERGGLGLDAAATRALLDSYLTSLSFYDDLPAVFSGWLDLVTRHGVVGIGSYDARLAAACLAHGMDALLTHNVKDFKRYGLKLLNPADVR